MPYYNQNVSTFQSSFSEYDLGDNSHGQHAQTSGYPSDYQLTSCTIYGTPIDESNNGQGIPTYEVLFYWNFTDKATTEARVTMPRDSKNILPDLNFSSRLEDDSHDPASREK